MSRWSVWRGPSGAWYADAQGDAAGEFGWRAFRTWRDAYDFADRMART